MESDSDSSDDVFEDALGIPYMDGEQNVTENTAVVKEDSGCDDNNSSVVVYERTQGEIGAETSGVCDTEDSDKDKVLEAAYHGDHTKDVVEDLLERGEQLTFDTSVETIDSIQKTLHEVHVHLTQTNIHNPSAIALGGQVVVNPSGEDDEKPYETPNPRPVTQLQKLRCDTEKRFHTWCEGMVKTGATQAVLDKISQGRTWITITGSPGEGKTTTGYLVLKHLHSMGRQVFDILTPEDYFKVKTSRQPVLMLNDILGSLCFDFDKRWREVLSDILSMVEHKREAEINDIKEKQHQPVVMLTCRTNVLKEASCHLGRFRDFILSRNGVVDLTHGKSTTSEEKIQIWKYHSGRYNVTVDERIVKEICQMPLLHGFPHCCRLFAAMYAGNRQLCMKSFFTKPLEFLNQTMESLLMDPVTGMLFREMLKHDGSLDLDSITDDNKRFQFSSLVQTLSGTYLCEDNGLITFHHPAVYESVAFVVCEKDPSFVIKNCSLSFLNDRVRFEATDYGGIQKVPASVTVRKKYVTLFLHRMKNEFVNCNLSQCLMQLALHDEYFASQFVQSVLPSVGLNGTDTSSSTNNVQLLIHTMDKHSKESFLFLSTKSGSYKILEYICDSTTLSEKELNEVLFGIIQHVSVSALMFLDTRYDLDFDKSNGNFQTAFQLAATKGSEEMLCCMLQKFVDIGVVDRKNNTPLHAVCRHGLDGDASVVKMMVDRGADVSHESNEYPWLPLSIASHYGHENVVKTLLECNADINQTSRGGITPLHNACWMGHANIVTLLIDRGADIDNTVSKINKGKTPLHEASFKGHLDVVKVLLDRGADVNKLSGVGQNTHLHYACMMGHVDVVTFLLDKGADVNKPNSVGQSPLLYACISGSVDVVTLMLDRGADVTKSCDVDGDTPLHVASWLGQEDVVKLLLENGAEINKSNGSVYEEKTALHDACHRGNLGVINVLVDMGADINKTDAGGNTPLYFAENGKHLDVVEVLSKRGATTRN